MNLDQYQENFYLRLRRGDLPVYSGNFQSSVKKTLSEIFSATRRWVGETRFDAWVQTYTAEADFKHWSRYRLGENFPLWFEQNLSSRGRRLKKDDAVAELLRYEQHIQETKLWGSTPFTGENRLSQWLQGEAKGISLSASCSLVDYKYDVVALVDQIESEKDVPPQAGRFFFCAGITAANTYAAISLSEDEKNFFAKLAPNLTFEAWIGTIPVGSPLGDPENLEKTLAKLLSRGWLSSGRTA